MTPFDSKVFLTKALSIAILRDSSSGGLIRIIQITKTGIREEVIPSVF
jgi:20S proteasome alpha/beta subunit